METAPTNIFVELMRTTITLATNLNCSPFEIFDQDCDEVILLINFYILLGAEKKEPVQTKSKETRIKVNDKTASGGWF